MPPAARVGDMTAHGGVITGPGVPTVLIGGMPAAVVGDLHTCPMVTGVVPHVGGPVLPPGVPTVLISGRPAAVVGGMATCVGPPDSII
ncbi:MAG: PAAR domain-containing protein, partial [Chloroflexi bacterium]|nr:PAAR domain-containing protein [Chloroflexota bacterium]